METEYLKAEPGGIARAAEMLRAGGRVAFPTETVYGLGADATSASAVASIYDAKGRPSFNPLIVHVTDANVVGRYCEVTPEAERAMAAFWPGPLTLVLARAKDCPLAPAVSAGLPSVAVRAPDHLTAAALLKASGLPLAAPSANPSGAVSPTTAGHVLDGLSGRIEAVLDAGACPVGVESTVIRLDTGQPILLRPGGVSREALQEVLGREVLQGADEATPSAPGQLASHYAPTSRVVLNVAEPPIAGVWLGFGPNCEGADLNLSASGDLAEAAAGLFSALRALDAKASQDAVIHVAPIPDKGIGIAINDRLRRAAAPR